MSVMHYGIYKIITDITIIMLLISQLDPINYMELLTLSLHCKLVIELVLMVQVSSKSEILFFLMDFGHFY